MKSSGSMDTIVNALSTSILIYSVLDLMSFAPGGWGLYTGSPWKTMAANGPLQLIDYSPQAGTS
jgi:hypothetical protein